MKIKFTSLKNFIISLSLLLFIVGCENTPPPAKNVVLNPLFTNNMVLQRNKEITIWGTAEPQSRVELELENVYQTGIANDKGKWVVHFPPMKAGGPYELIVKGEKTYKIKNVMLGEVWICSGQSNMEMPVNSNWAKVKNADKEVADANYPNIRLLTVKHATSTIPLDTISSTEWQQCSPGTIAGFSATAYFFGRSLYKNLNIPVGLIHSSWGGTVAEAWTSEETLKNFPAFADEITLLKSSMVNLDEAMKEYRAKMKIREEKLAKTGKGFHDGKYIWNEPELNTSDWKEMKLPTLWERAGYKNLDGVVWFRKKVIIPFSMSEEELTLHFGRINDDDITWFNGVRVGATKGANEKRNYKISKSIVKSGENIIAVRVFDLGNNGGIYGQPDDLKITDNAGRKIALKGSWKYKIGLDVPPVPKSPNNPNQPTVLYNAMIQPLIPYTFRGAIWYQGESNASRAFQYRTLFPALINDWRSHWNQGDFPFYFVQLANFLQHQTTPADDEWAELREAQSMALDLPNTGMAVAIDIGEADNIHPRNKQEVGRRLALNALKLTYNQKIENSGPVYKSMQVEGNKIRLSFTHINSGLEAKGSDSLKGFAITGADKKFVWATAKIDGNTVVVSSPKVKKPVAVRYAWASNPICNLYNKAGLPASPFRTDVWKGITEGNK